MPAPRSKAFIPPPAAPSLRPAHWVLPALVLAAGTALAWFTNVDQALSLRYYDAAAATPWPQGSMPFWVWLYRYANMPSVLLFVGGVLLAGFTYGDPRGQSARRAGALVALALALGPLLIVNGVLKPYYGRPRPVQVQTFGGTQPYARVLMPTFRRDENSFPSGHAAAAFAPVVFYFVLRRRHPGAAWTALALSLGYGGIVSYMRIIQGGHFFSDVLWSGGVVYFAAYAVTRWQGRGEARAGRFTRDPPPASRLWVGLVRGGAGALALLVLAIYLARIPYFTTLEWRVPLPPGVTQARLAMGAAHGRMRIVEVPGLSELHLRIRIDGRGLPGAAVWDERAAETMPQGLALRYALHERGIVGRTSAHASIEIPPGFVLNVERLAPAAAGAVHADVEAESPAKE